MGDLCCGDVSGSVKGVKERWVNGLVSDLKIAARDELQYGVVWSAAGGGGGGGGALARSLEIITVFLYPSTPLCGLASRALLLQVSSDLLRGWRKRVEEGDGGAGQQAQDTPGKQQLQRQNQLSVQQSSSPRQIIDGTDSFILGSLCEGICRLLMGVGEAMIEKQGSQQQQQLIQQPAAILNNAKGTVPPSTATLFPSPPHFSRYLNHLLAFLTCLLETSMGVADPEVPSLHVFNQHSALLTSALTIATKAGGCERTTSQAMLLSLTTRAVTDDRAAKRFVTHLLTSSPSSQVRGEDRTTNANNSIPEELFMWALRRLWGVSGGIAARSGTGARALGEREKSLTLEEEIVLFLVADSSKERKGSSGSSSDGDGGDTPTPFFLSLLAHQETLPQPLLLEKLLPLALEGHPFPIPSPDFISLLAGSLSTPDSAAGDFVDSQQPSPGLAFSLAPLLLSHPALLPTLLPILFSHCALAGGGGGGAQCGSKNAPPPLAHLLAFLRELLDGGSLPPTLALALTTSTVTAARKHPNAWSQALDSLGPSESARLSATLKQVAKTEPGVFGGQGTGTGGTGGSLRPPPVGPPLSLINASKFSRISKGQSGESGGGASSSSTSSSTLLLTAKPQPQMIVSTAADASFLAFLEKEDEFTRRGKRAVTKEESEGESEGEGESESEGHRKQHEKEKRREENEWGEGEEEERNRGGGEFAPESHSPELSSVAVASAASADDDAAFGDFEG